MKKITIILPIHKLDEDETVMLANALLSVESFHNDIVLMIVSPPDINKKLELFDFGGKLEVKLIENTTKNTEFTAQVNLGITNCETEWFSILEIDDEYTKQWLPMMWEYIAAYSTAEPDITDVDVFLPIVKDINKEGEFVSFTNESAWAYGFTETQGFIDKEVLLEYQNYQTSGGLYRTNVIKEMGMFKDNFKLTFSYEFLLRLSHFGIKLMVVPKVGYIHVNLREGSLFWSYKNDENTKLKENEVKFWIEQAKKEYYFKNKRDVVYTEV